MAIGDRHSQVRWRFVRSHYKPRLMGVASHRSFPGGILPPEIQHVEPENAAFQKKSPVRGRLLCRFHVKFQGCKVDFALSLYGNGFALFFCVCFFFFARKVLVMNLACHWQNATIAEKRRQWVSLPMGLLGPSWINRQPLFPGKGGKWNMFHISSSKGRL